MSTRDQLIDATAELLWERGYMATSPAMIQKRARAGQGSMYHHFTGKAALASAAMHRTAAQMRDEVEAALAGHDSALGRILGYLEQERDPLLGCRLGRMVQDPDVMTSDELRPAAAEFFGWLRQRLAEVLTEGQRSGELRPGFDPGQVAALVVATVQGGFVLARAEQAGTAYQLAVAGAAQAVAGLAADPECRQS